VSRLAVIGAGGWGTALAIALARRFDSVQLWARDPERAAEIAQLHENRRYLSGCLLPSHVQVSNDLALTLADADIALSVVPSQHLRSVLQRVRPHLSAQTRLVSGTKGIEEATLARMSQVMSEVLPCSSSSIAVLSGPTFAREVAAGEPTAVVIASEDTSAAEEIQHAFSTPSLRLYVSRDVIGVELGAALKNVIAIGAGICRGLGLGNNSVAALITRGLAEMTRLVVACGGEAETMAGLAGLGDLVLTCTGGLSRNRSVGVELGRGRKLPEILAGMHGMVAEGIFTTTAAVGLARARGVEMPITEQMHAILHQGKAPREAISELMARSSKSEMFRV